MGVIGMHTISSDHLELGRMMLARAMILDFLMLELQPAGTPIMRQARVVPQMQTLLMVSTLGEQLTQLKDCRIINLRSMQAEDGAHYGRTGYDSGGTWP
jgi:hypothetical protein